MKKKAMRKTVQKDVPCRSCPSSALVLLVLFVILAGAAFVDYARHPDGRLGMMDRSSVTIFTVDGKAATVDVEVADDEQEWKRGLMKRTYLPQDSGMLFVFPASGVVSFWMKNMSIPLDFIYIRDNGVIADILHDIPPCPPEPASCDSHASTIAVQYVLEVNANFTLQHGIRVGDYANITLPSP